MPALISVVIPTRSRPETLDATLRSAVEQDFDNYEIIVSDNNSEDNTREVVERVGSGKVRYFNTGKRLSMCDNWEFALTHVTGEYVIFIGDDDAIMPGGLRLLANQIAVAGVDAYTWQTSTYQWPIDGRVAQFVHDAGVTHRPPKQGDLRKEAISVLQRGGWGYYRLPSVYHGAVATRALKAIAAASGRVFHSTTPDLFTALAIPAFVDKFVRLSSPVTLQGRSAKSNGGASVATNGDRVTNQFIQEYGDYKLHPSMLLLPKPVGSLIAESFILAKDLFPSVYGSVDFNYSAMWAFLRRLCLVNKKFIYAQHNEIRRHHKINFFEFELYCLAHDLIAFRRKLIVLTSKKGELKCIPDNIFDFSRLFSAENILTKD